MEKAHFLVYALIELLMEKGLLSLDEISSPKKQVTQELLRKFMQYYPGVVIQEQERDKYTFEQTVKIDCENRVHLCKAACCKMVFPLSRQDIEEDIIQWNLRKPYMIAQGEDGYCHHCDRQSLSCTIHAQRPIPCRTYDCRSDTRIWLDFENKIVNPKLNAPNWPHNLTAEEMEFPKGEME